MGVGVEVWDDQGQKILGLNDRLGSFFGSLQTQGNFSGTHVDARLIGRDPVFAAITNSPGDRYGGVRISLNKNTGQISWEFVSTSAGGASWTPNEFDRDYTIFYGAM